MSLGQLVMKHPQREISKTKTRKGEMKIRCEIATLRRDS